ncbi:hypothetical protein GXM_06228 [Nostoc sphaeroides CCNUC1]|uniref:Uncharacterized protein n=1 Tax=Nostoc sphaeroides CCNUC1 TaxID=2653204 RepID=A0A5P8W7V0_9NOSO|nr:hypothetical protein GXM_06228 [Nostoc sphaeroides CCNUC1]
MECNSRTNLGMRQIKPIRNSQWATLEDATSERPATKRAIRN